MFEISLKLIISSTITFLNISYLTFTTLLMIFPAHVQESKKARNAFLTGSIAGGTIMFTLILLSILVLGPLFSYATMYPSYELARRIQWGNFLHGVEILIAVMWFLSLYFKLSIYFYATASSLAQIFELREYKSLTFPLAIIVVVLSITVYPSVTYQKVWDTETWLPYSLIIGLIYPLVLLVVGLFRKSYMSRMNSVS